MTWLENNGNRIGLLAAPFLVIGAYLALSWSPPDIHMGQDVRMMYIHVPTIWTGYVAFTVALVASLMLLWKKDLRWDDLAVAAAEIGVVLTALAIIAGAIWGKLTWGVYWTWDPRLTTTAVLFVIFVGYLLLRALSEDQWLRARISAVVAIIGFVDIPVVQFSVVWWRSLHQGPSLTIASTSLDSRMQAGLIVNTIAYTLVFIFLLSKRLKLARVEREAEEVVWAMPELSPAVSPEPRTLAPNAR